MSSHIGVASCNDTIYVASVDSFDNASHHTHHNYKYCSQEPMSIVTSSSFDATNNIQHVNPYSSTISSQYVVPPHDMPMNERSGYDNDNTWPIALKIQHHMPMFLLIIRLHMLLTTRAELIKIQQGI
jgi:hypothetical protein